MSDYQNSGQESNFQYFDLFISNFQELADFVLMSKKNGSFDHNEQDLIKYGQLMIHHEADLIFFCEIFELDYNDQYYKNFAKISQFSE